MFSEVKNFILEQFWLPLATEANSYNIYNTSMYATIFALLLIYVFLPVLRKMDVNPDKDFFLSAAPWITLTGALSAVNELGLRNILLEAPFLFTGVVITATATLYMATKFEKYSNIDRYKLFLGTGLLLNIFLLGLFTVKNTQAILLTAGIISTWFVLGLGFLKVFRPSLLSYSFTLPVAAHYLDATSTAVALKFGAREQHIIAQHFLDIFGIYGVFVLKTLIIVPITFFIIKEYDYSDKKFYLFLIAALGLGIAVRNFVQVFFMV